MVLAPSSYQTKYGESNDGDRYGEQLLMVIWPHKVNMLPTLVFRNSKVHKPTYFSAIHYKTHVLQVENSLS